MKVVCGFAMAVAALNAGEFRAGAAQVDMASPPGAPMAGYYYNRAAAGVHDPLQAEAIVVEKDGVTAAMVACDVASLPRPIAEDARRRISESLKIPLTHVMISATHTHTGPVLLSGPTRYNWKAT
jgi:neutral ceramidase